MRHVFADAHYWIAITNPADRDHRSVQTALAKLGDVTIHTTDEVLAEYLTYESGRGPKHRASAVQLVRRILNAQGIQVWPQTRLGFLRALDLYENRQDKGYSLVDCHSMLVMRRHHIHHVLTRDRHFEQEGFTVLIRD
jgi:uncharacterized protein